MGRQESGGCPINREQRHQNEDRLFPLIKGGFRGLSFFLVNRRLQPPGSPFAKGENQFTPHAFHEIQLLGQSQNSCQRSHVVLSTVPIRNIAGSNAIGECCILKQLSAFSGNEAPEPIVPTIQPRARAAGSFENGKIAVDAESVLADLCEIEFGKAHQVNFVDHHSR